MIGAVLGGVAAYLVQTQAATWLRVVKKGDTYNNTTNNLIAAALGAAAGYAVLRALR